LQQVLRSGCIAQSVLQPAPQLGLVLRPRLHEASWCRALPDWLGSRGGNRVGMGLAGCGLVSS
jgi:hypothetical protein